MKYADGSEELYEMKKDPKQFINLVKNPEYASILQEQRKSFLQRIKETAVKLPVAKKGKKKKK